MNEMKPFSIPPKSPWNHSLIRVFFLFFVCVAGVANSSPIHTLNWNLEGDAIWFDQGGTVQQWRFDCCEIQVEPWITTDWKTISAIEPSPDGNWIALGGGVAGEMGAVSIYDTNSHQLAHHQDTFSDLVTSLSWTSDSQRLAIGSYDHSIVILQKQESSAPSLSGSFIPISTLSGHSRAVLDLCFSNDNQHLISCGSDRSIKVWNLSANLPTRSLSNHTDRILALSPRPTQYFNDTPLPFTCASASDDQTVRIWQPVIGRMVRIVRNHEASVLNVDWDPTGRFVYSADTDGVIRKIEGNSDQILMEVKTGLDWIHALKISPQGDLLAAGDWNGDLQIWKTSSDSNQLSLTHSLTKGKVNQHE